jgi:hypothetical protein
MVDLVRSRSAVGKVLELGLAPETERSLERSVTILKEALAKLTN